MIFTIVILKEIEWIDAIKENLYYHVLCTPSVSFYFSLDSAILHYPATNKKKRREYYFSLITNGYSYIFGGLDTSPKVRVNTASNVESTYVMRVREPSSHVHGHHSSIYRDDLIYNSV
jgi:hypothetical protein